MKKYLIIVLLFGICFGQLFEITYNNGTRDYWVDYPENATEETPLVITMHGRNQFIITFIPQSQMSNFANPQNVAVVYPQGLNFWGVPAWNTGVWWSNSIYDDVGYINALIDSVSSNFAIDTNRIYACGFSNGGFMAYDLACELPDRIVAFGSVSGNFMMNSNQDCTNEREIPIMHIHGTSDLIVNYYPPTIDASMTSLQAMEWWSIENNLTEQVVEPLNDNVNIYTNTSLTSNTEFVHFQVVSGGHEWFNYDWGFHASEELLNFFLQYSMTDFFDHSPVLSIIEDHQTYEDMPFSVAISAVSPIGSQINYNAYSDTSAIAVYLNGDNIFIGLQQHWNGVGNITVIANDEDQLSDTITFGVEVLPVNDSPSNFELLYPTLLDTIEISINTDEIIPFEWMESSDVDSEVSYNLTLTFDHDGNSYRNEYDIILDTNYAISAYEYAILMNDLNLAIVNIHYFVEATDGEFTVESDSGKFVVSNISLSIENNFIPKDFALHQNYPNPFNPVTSLRYNLPNDDLVNITIHNMMGIIVKTLVNSSQTAGYKSIQWNSTNDRNELVSAGIYLYTIQAGEFRQTKKMVLLK